MRDLGGIYAYNAPNLHPGEILLEEFLEPLSISQYRLAKDISVSPRRINEIVHGKRAISADTQERPKRPIWKLVRERFASERLEAEVRVLERRC